MLGLINTWTACHSACHIIIVVYSWPGQLTNPIASVLPPPYRTSDPSWSDFATVGGSSVICYCYGPSFLIIFLYYASEKNVYFDWFYYFFTSVAHKKDAMLPANYGKPGRTIRRISKASLAVFNSYLSVDCCDPQWRMKVLQETFI